MAERAWSSNADYDAFMMRLPSALNVLGKCGVEYTPVEKANPKRGAAALETLKFGLNLIDKTTLPSLIRAAKAKSKR